MHTMSQSLLRHWFAFWASLKWSQVELQSCCQCTTQLRGAFSAKFKSSWKRCESVKCWRGRVCIQAATSALRYCKFWYRSNNKLIQYQYCWLLWVLSVLQIQVLILKYKKVFIVHVWHIFFLFPKKTQFSGYMLNLEDRSKVLILLP